MRERERERELKLACVFNLRRYFVICEAKGFSVLFSDLVYVYIFT